ncbi:hypothetical protein D3C78_926210 [compost metagenome]
MDEQSGKIVNSCCAKVKLKPVYLSMAVITDGIATISQHIPAIDHAQQCMPAVDG